MVEAAYQAKLEEQRQLAHARRKNLARLEVDHAKSVEILRYVEATKACVGNVAEESVLTWLASAEEVAGEDPIEPD